MALRPRGRMHIRLDQLHHGKQALVTNPQQCRGYAAVAAVAPAPPVEQLQEQPTPIQRYDPKVPPSLKPADLRKSQLLRQYTSLIYSSPLTIFFQHNSLKANEWSAIRRELSDALRKTSSSSSSSSSTSSLTDTPDPADSIRLQVIHAGIFAVALRIVEFYTPATESASHQSDPSAPIHAFDQHDTVPTHALSAAAHEATLHPSAVEFRNSSSKKFTINPRAHIKRDTPVHAILRGPIAALTFPLVTPEHLATALSILSPTPGARSAFPAPRRSANPRYHDPVVQSGLQKLILLGARVEGRALDNEGVKWVGGLAARGGLPGLRAQLIGILQQAGASLTGALEGASRSLWVTMESRRISLEEEGDQGKASDKNQE